MKQLAAGLALLLIAGSQFWLWSEARARRRPKARNHLIAGVLLGTAGLILLSASQ